MPGWYRHDGQYPDLFERTKDRLITLLMDVLSDQNILKYDLNKTFAAMYPVSSPDNRVWICSLNEKSGGTYQSCVSILHERSRSSEVRSTLLSEATNMSSFHSVYALDTLTGSYLALGGTKTCTSCYYALAITINPDSSDAPQILHSFDGRTYDPYEFSFNDTSKILTYNYSYTTTEYDSPSSDNGEYDYGDHVLRFTYIGKFELRHGQFVRIGECWSSEEVE